MRMVKWKNCIGIGILALCLTLNGCSAAEKAADLAEEALLSHMNPSDDSGNTGEQTELPSRRETAPEDSGQTGPAADSAEEKAEDLCYYYSVLEEDDRSIYDAFYEGLSAHSEDILLDTEDTDLVYKLYEMILADHPELFWVDGGYSYLAGHMNIKVIPEYSYSVSEVEVRQSAIDQVTDRALEEILAEGPATDYEIVKAVFEYVVKNVSYDTKSTDNQNLYSAMVNRESVCAGYTRETQYLLQQLGIQALFISGEVKDVGSHAWNMVRCDGQYYLVDATYGDCAFQGEDIIESLPEALTCDYNYLCCTDTRLMANRTYHEWAILPRCDSENLNYYRLNGRYYESVGEELTNDLKESILAGDTYWSCQFSNREAYEEFLGMVKESYYLKLVLQLCELGQVKGYSTYNDDFYSVSCWYY